MDEFDDILRRHREQGRAGTEFAAMLDEAIAAGWSLDAIMKDQEQRQPGYIERLKPRVDPGTATPKREGGTLAGEI